MLFPIKYIEHDIEKVHEIPHHFFTELQKDEITTFCEELFPIWMRGNNYRGSRAIRTRFGKLYELIQNSLNDNQRQSLYQAFFDSNRIAESCSNINTTPTRLNDLDCPDEVRIYLKELFVWLYDDVLTKKNSTKAPKTIKIIGKDIHNHYEKYELGNPRICPFCGKENIQLLKSEKRAGYDHYFHKSAYGFSSVNMRNLIPMCRTCNEIKHNHDILHDKNGNRTTVFYPFLFNKKYNQDFNFLLYCDELPSKNNHNRGTWRIELLSTNNSNAELNAWKHIFKIDERYAELISKGHLGWFETMLRNKNIINIEKLSEALTEQIQHYYPNLENLKNTLETIPRYLYFRFLNEEATFVTELLNLFIEKPRAVDNSNLSLD